MYPLPSPLPTHDLATIVHHSVVDSLAVISNILLILAVVFRSPKSLRFEEDFLCSTFLLFRSYKVLLLNAGIIDLLSSFSMLMLMVR